MSDSAQIVQFLYDRLDEDEAIAQAARWRTDQEEPLERLEFPGGWLSAERIEEAGLDEQTAAQIMRWSPRRALLEVNGKRAIVQRFAMAANDYETAAPMRALADDVLRQLVQAYAGSPGYKLDWSPRA